MRRFLFLIIAVSLLILNIDIHKNTTLLSLVSEDFDVVVFDCNDNEYLVINGDIDEFINGLDIVIINKLSLDNGTEIYEGYTNKLTKSVSSKGQRINIQISKTDDGFCVGYPLIKKSFWFDV